jgi:DNA-binding response OmpR family regulator
LFVKNLRPEIEIKGLGAYSDGTIRYKGEVIPMRTQLKTLCWFFIRHPNRLLTPEDMRDEIVHADRRKSTPRVTVAKYVSELHGLLKLHFKKDVIFNQQQEGWYFKP